jgi:hypothetical protein
MAGMEADRPRPKKGSPCPKCGNMLRLRPDLMGTEVMCPKCNATFVVGQPAAKPVAPAADDLYEPEVPLKRSSIVPEDEFGLPLEDARQSHPIVHEPEATLAQPPADAEAVADLPTSSALARDIVYETDWSTEPGELLAEAPHRRPTKDEPDYLALAKARGIVQREVRMYVPRWTFFSGVWKFAWQGPNMTRWTMMAIGLAACGAILIPIAQLMQGGPSLAMPLLAMIGAAMLLVTLSCAAAFFLAAVQDTADGLAQVQESTLPDWDQWFFSLLSLLSLAILSGALGYPFVFVEEVGPAAIPICSMIFFPVLVLSAMECESFLIPFSPPVLRSLLRQWPVWLAFYFISTLLISAWGAATAFGLLHVPYLSAIASGLALSAAVLIYARLLGRVAWRITGASPRRKQMVESPTTTAKPGKKKRRRRGIDFPPDLDQAARYVTDQPPPGQADPFG